MVSESQGRAAAECNNVYVCILPYSHLSLFCACRLSTVCLYCYVYFYAVHTCVHGSMYDISCVSIYITYMRVRCMLPKLEIYQPLPYFFLLLYFFLFAAT